MKLRKRRKANYELRKCIDIENASSNPCTHKEDKSEFIAGKVLSKYFGSFFYAEVYRKSESSKVCFYRCNWQTCFAKSMMVPPVQWLLASLYSIFSVTNQYERIMNLCFWEMTISITILELAFLKGLWQNEDVFTNALSQMK